MSETLYEIADLRHIINAALEASEGELTPEMEAALDGWDGAFNDKAERVALYICEEESLAERARNAAKAIVERAVSRERRAASLKAYLLRQMQSVGKERVDGVLKSVVVQKNPPAVKGELNQSELYLLYEAWRTQDAPEIVRHVDEYVLDRKAALAAYKAGKPLPAGLSVEQGIGLRIK